MNWKLIAGLAVVGLGAFAVAPGAIGTVAPLLIVAVCPLSMLFMMGNMPRLRRALGAEPASLAQRGSGDSGWSPSVAQASSPSEPRITGLSRLERLRAWHAELASVQVAQDERTSEVAWRDTARAPAPREAEAAARAASGV